jgi:hypothetical protein
LKLIGTTTPVHHFGLAATKEMETKMVDRETIITDRGGGAGAGGMIVATVGAVVLVLLVPWLFNGGSLNLTGPSGSSTTVDVDVPAVTVTPAQ